MVLQAALLSLERAIDAMASMIGASALMEANSQAFHLHGCVTNTGVP